MAAENAGEKPAEKPIEKLPEQAKTEPKPAENLNKVLEEDKIPLIQKPVQTKNSEPLNKVELFPDFKTPQNGNSDDHIKPVNSLPQIIDTKKTEIQKVGSTGKLEAQSPRKKASKSPKV